jgi:hypothetical protein
MELITTQVQTVEPNSSVLYQAATSSGNQSILWRIGSGIITLRGLGPQNRARFRISAHLNVALSADAAKDPIEVAFAVNGEAIGTTRMVSTPAAVGEFNSIGTSSFIDVASGCCTEITLKNIGTTDIDVENVTVTVERVA